MRSRAVRRSRGPVADHRSRRARPRRRPGRGPWHRPTRRPRTSCLKKRGIHEIHAARPGRPAVDDHDLPVQAQVGAAHKGAEDADRQGGAHIDAGVLEPLRLLALPPRAGPERIDEQTAGNAPLGGPNDRLQDLVRLPPSFQM